MILTLQYETMNFLSSFSKWTLIVLIQVERFHVKKIKNWNRAIQKPILQKEIHN